MEHTVPPEILYSAYWYRSGTNDTMRNHLRTIAEEATALVAKPATRVLDIGCNDGTLLGCYPADFEKFGVDPSDVTRRSAVTSPSFRTFFHRKSWSNGLIIAAATSSPRSLCFMI
jgi:hypothetical protein